MVGLRGELLSMHNFNALVSSSESCDLNMLSKSRSGSSGCESRLLIRERQSATVSLFPEQYSTEKSNGCRAKRQRIILGVVLSELNRYLETVDQNIL